MASIPVTVASAVGLHARPASLIAEAAQEYDEEITIALADDPEEDPADATSSLMIMTLGAEHGTRVIVTSDNEAAATRIAELIATDLDAE